jgi:putative membrane protein insertion efficiency factor
MQNNIWETVKKVAIWPFVMLIRFYQVCISPLKPACCRFTPTCSQYGLQAFRKHGPIKGLLLTTWRILRCQPWGGSGYDPVPEEFKPLRKILGLIWKK